MRLVFAGTPEPAAVSLQALLNSDHEVVAVLTRPDAPKGRGRTLLASPVKELAIQHGIKVLTPKKLTGNDEIRQQLRDLTPDAIPVVAYGNLVPEDMLTIAKHGWINLHFSLLPRWRGAAPVQAAIHNGDEITGATTFRINAGLDTGDILGRIEEAVQPRDTADDLLTRLAYRGADLLVDTMNGLEEGTLTAHTQPEEGTYAPKIVPSDARIDWTADSKSIDRSVRAHTPAPGAWTTLEGQRVKVGPLEPIDVADDLSPGAVRVAKDEVLVGTGTTPVRLGRIQPPGKKMMDAADWARGLKTTEEVSFE